MRLYRLEELGFVYNLLLVFFSTQKKTRPGQTQFLKKAFENQDRELMNIREKIFC